MRYLISVLFAPRETFKLVREKVDWVSPVLVLGLLTALYQMVLGQSEFTLSTLLTFYGMSVLQICLTMLLFGLIMLAVKSMLRATEGTFWQLCKVKLFSLAPNLLYFLWKFILLLVAGVSDVAVDDQSGMLLATAMIVVDLILGVVTAVWSVYLLVIGASVTIGKSGDAVFGRLAIICVIFLAISLLVSL